MNDKELLIELLEKELDRICNSYLGNNFRRIHRYELMMYGEREIANKYETDKIIEIAHTYFAFIDELMEME
jgi:hypothetical protein